MTSHATDERLFESEWRTLIIERHDAVATITLNRPAKKNAMSGTMFAELYEAFVAVERSAATRVLVVTGAGGDFCSGADQTPASDEAGALEGLHPVSSMRRIGDVALALHRLTKPTIAQVDGVAVGAGCNLALGCDLVIASERARFSEIFARRALSIDFGGSWLLPRIVGLQRAKQLALLADIIDARHAESLGLVTEVVSVDALATTVRGYAERVAAGPPVALALTKTLLNNSFMVSMDQALEDEARAQVVNQATADTLEARDAFVQKREPKFSGTSLFGRDRN